MKTLKDFGCKSNPFDVLTQTALNMQELLFLQIPD